MKLSSEQQQILKVLLQRARQQGASPREVKALIEAGLVESNLRNLNYGDRDSLGVLQQRPSQGWGNATDPSLAALDFLKHAQALNRKGFKGSAGQLAQAVQRSAFPGRYDERSAQADALIGRGVSSPGTRTTTTTTTPGVDNSALRAQLIAAYLGNTHDPSALTTLAAGLLSAKDTAATTSTRSTGGTSKGKASKKGLAPLLELFYDPVGGYDNGKSIGPIGGHSDHVHVATGPKTLKRLEQLARQHGLTITSTTGGKHVAGSFHYQGKAFDAGGDPARMAAFTKAVKRLYNLK